AEHVVVQYDVRGRIVRRWRDEANAARPVAVAVPEDRRELFVGDGASAQIVVFDPLGRTLRLLGGRRGAILQSIGAMCSAPRSCWPRPGVSAVDRAASAGSRRWRWTATCSMWLTA